MKKTVCSIISVLMLCLSVDVPFFSEKNVYGAEAATVELPVFAIDAQDGLPFLLEKIRGKSLFLLGDASHGTEEFYGFRKQVTRHLIKDYGVRIVVLEAEWDSGKLLDSYINGQLVKELGAREMLAEAFTRWPQWVWANEELVEFVLWLKDFNQGRAESDRVHCYGMDMQLAVDASLEFLSKQFPLDSIAGQKQVALRTWWQAYVNDPISYKEEIAAGNGKTNLIATELLNLQENPSVDLRRVLTMLAATEKYYRVMAADKYMAWNVRSNHMAGYVTELVRSDQGGKGVVVWAHNSHVGDMSGNDVEGTGLQNLGQLMRRELGSENVFILGSSSYEGSVLAALNWDAVVQEFAVSPALEGSVEYLLGNAEWDNLLLFFENEEQRLPWSTPLLHRGIGVVYEPEEEIPDNYMTTYLSKRYDALVFWKKTRALRKLMNP